MRSSASSRSSALLGLGVIGAGGRGFLAKHAHDPEGLGSHLVAACDTNPAALEKARAAYGADLFVTEDYRALLARQDVDAVFVTTPDFLHEEHAVAALAAGKHVYLEKPMAITLAGCDRILRTAREAGRRLFVGHNMRHMKVVLKMKELIDRGAIGEVKAAWCRHFVAYGGDAYFKDWHADRTRSTGLLLQKAAHDLDVMHWLCGGYTRRVVAQGALTLYDRIADRHPPGERGDASWHDENWPPLSQRGLNPVLDVEDVSHVLMEYDNGVLATYQQCHFTPDKCRNYTFIGTAGRIENIGDAPGSAVVRLWNRRGDFPQGNEQFPIPEATGGHGGADPSIVAEFVNFVRHGGKVSTSPVAARYSVAAGFLATESLRDGSTPRDVPPLPEDLRAYFAAFEA